ncbi:MAG TPA: DivIVA domain-containing protein [Myxococcota bacterium]|nr:DivIVA domain-containing protein [Myxococcota bacterium]
MRMTALDVQNHTFPRRLKGYDVDEVEQFRSALVEDWTALTAEAEGLRRRVAELEARVDELDHHEQALRNALVTAQGMSDELRRTAEHEAQMRVGRAELQAEQILAGAHREASRLAQDVRELRSLRSRMAGSVRATIETHLALLEGFSQDPEEEMDGPSDARIAALASPQIPKPRDDGAEQPGERGQVVEVEIRESPPHPATRKLDAFVIPTGSAKPDAAPAPGPTAADPPAPGRALTATDPPAPGWTVLPERG